MIIWLASYPKSGNTWLRAFITSLIYPKNKDNILNNIKYIDQYPIKNHFQNLLSDFNDFNKIAKNWEISQSLINLDNKIRFFKTHHILCQIKESLFTNYQNTLGVIHIVRDPRNVITSLKHHYSLDNYDQALEFMLDYNKFSGRLDKKENLKQAEFPAWISTWKNHYNSWKSFKKNYLLIRYEDLIHNPQKNFFKISRYIGKITKIDIEKDTINNAIINCSFDKLKKIEEKEGFIESAIDKYSKTQKKFFNLGPENKWEKNLPTSIKLKIENEFKKEMEELGYL